MGIKKLLLKTVLVILPLAVIGSLAQAASCNTDDTNFSCVDFIRNPDGDTVYVDLPGTHPLLGERIAIRISGIDTGEMRAYKGRSQCEKEMAVFAKEELEEILSAANSIKLTNARRGKYFRILVDIVVDKKSVGKYLVKKHLAVHYSGGARGGVDWCAMLEKYKRTRRTFYDVSGAVEL